MEEKEIKCVSDITINDIAKYIRLDIDEDNDLQNELKTYLKVAKNYRSNYTGIPENTKTENQKDQEETLDSFSDFIIVVYILCQDMYDNRTMYVDGKNINKVVQTILDMHVRINL